MRRSSWNERVDELKPTGHKNLPQLFRHLPLVQNRIRGFRRIVDSVQLWFQETGLRPVEFVTAPAC